MTQAAPRGSGCGLLVAAAVACLPAIAGAQGWSGQATLYGWGAGVTGDFTPTAGAPTLSFDASLSEVLEDLDAAFFATGLARRGNLVLFGDLTYTSSSRSGLTPLGPASGDVTIRSLTLAAGRRFDLQGETSLDVLGGFRAWQLDGRVNSVPLSVAPQADFVDPVVGLRLNTALNDRWSLLGYVDLGGGTGSDLTLQAALTANYRATDNLYLSFGWRHLYLDYSDNGTAFEGAMTGPLAGITLRF